jgi:hypothetical protein
MCFKQVLRLSFFALLFTSCNVKVIDYIDQVCTDVNSVNYGQLGDCLYGNEKNVSVLFIITTNSNFYCGDSVYKVTNTLDPLFADDLEIAFIHLADFKYTNNNDFVQSRRVANYPKFYINGELVTEDYVKTISDRIESQKTNAKYNVVTQIEKDVYWDIYTSTVVSLKHDASIRNRSIVYYLNGDGGVGNQRSLTNEGHIPALYDSALRSYIDVKFNNISMGATTSNSSGHGANFPETKGLHYVSYNRDESIKTNTI